MAWGMKHAAKSVSWAPGLKLCQVRLFLSEDAPSLSGFAVQDHLQAKASRLLHLGGGENDESLPPGFETPYHMNIKQLKYESSQIKPTKWKCPVKFSIKDEWFVVSGEASKEVDAENKRQLGMLEAIYPRASSIPPNPCVSPEIERSSYDDSHTALVPIVEEEEMDQSCEVLPVPDQSTPEQLPNSSTCFIPSVSHGLQPYQGNVTVSDPPNLPSTDMPRMPTIPGVEPDVAAAASAVFTAIMKNNDKSSPIDHELLIKILSDPKVVEKLILDNEGQNQVQPTSMPSQLPAFSMPVTTVSVQPHGLMISAPSPTPPGHVPFNDSSFSSGSNSQLYSPQNTFPTQHQTNTPQFPLVPPSNNMPTRNVPPMDPNYINKSTAQSQSPDDLAHFKSLIHQHGSENNLPDNWDTYPSQYFNGGRRNNVDRVEFQQQTIEQERDAKINGRGIKPTNICMYYNSPKGCRKGLHCTFIHDPSLPQRLGDLRNTKRVKLDRE